jgi:fatty acid elongase 3
MLQGYQHIVYRQFSHLPHIGDCAGELGTAIFGCVLVTIYLGLFVNFYVQTYKGSTSKLPKSSEKGLPNGLPNGKDV